MPLSLAQAAQRIGLSEQTLQGWRWRSSHGLPLHPAAKDFCSRLVQVGRSVRISEEDLASWRKTWRARPPRGALGNPESAIEAVREGIGEAAERARAAGLNPIADLLSAVERVMVEGDHG